MGKLKRIGGVSAGPPVARPQHDRCHLFHCIPPLNLTDYSLTAPLINPWIKKRCTKLNKIATGKVVITLAAIISCQ